MFSRFIVPSSLATLLASPAWAAPEGLQPISDAPAVFLEAGEEPVLGAAFLSKSRMVLLDGTRLDLTFVSEDIEAAGDDAMGAMAAFQRFTLKESSVQGMADPFCEGKARIMSADIWDASPQKITLSFYENESFDTVGPAAQPCAEMTMDRVAAPTVTPAMMPAVTPVAAAADERPRDPEEPVDPEDIFSGPPNAALAPPRPEEYRGKWQTQVGVNPMDDSKTVVLVLQADEGRSRMGSPITFYARCKSNTTEVYINWHDYLGDDYRDVYSDSKDVQVRIGTQPARNQVWGVSTDNEATFAPEWAGSLLQQMVGQEKMVVSTTPYSESPVTAVFNIRGLEHHLGELADTCGWSFVVPKP